MDDTRLQREVGLQGSTFIYSIEVIQLSIQSNTTHKHPIASSLVKHRKSSSRAPTWRASGHSRFKLARPAHSILSLTGTRTGNDRVRLSLITPENCYFHREREREKPSPIRTRYHKRIIRRRQSHLDLRLEIT